MSKQHTLFSFFKKLPSPVVQNNSGNEEKTEPKTDENFVTPKKTRNSSKPDIGLCSLVWAKLEGYPWWPSLVCKHPTTKKHMKANSVHVQFFDDPPTRAWIQMKCIEAYDPNSPKKNPKIISASDMKMLKKACDEADKAYNMTLDQRSDLLVNFHDVSGTSDSAKSEDEAEEGSPGTDKENHDINEPSPKRKKVFAFDSEDSEDEYKPDKNENDDDDDDDESSGDDSNASDQETVEEETEPEETPKKSGKRKRKKQLHGNKPKKLSLSTPSSTPVSESKYSGVSDGAKAKLSFFKNTPSATPKGPDDRTDNWPHLKLDFLQPDKIMDKQRRRPDHPEYDKTTLYVPESYKNKLTPGVRQWWDLKEDNFDCVLFFKVGKFYELYHMDAVIGVNELSLTYMRGEFAHSGFPEIAFGRFANILVQKGYKVARVEQTETPEMMAERCKQMQKSTKFDKVVSREICQITTRGTQTFSYIDGEAKESETNYLLAITEKCDEKEDIFGICFVDTSIGTFHLGQFKDDKYLSYLRTLLSHHPPVQIIYEKNRLTPNTMQLLKTSFSSFMHEALTPETQFWSANKTLSYLADEKYFSDESGITWPDAIKTFINKADSLGLTPSEDGELALKAFGASIWYLKRCYLDQQVLAMKKFEVYTPVFCSKSAEDFDRVDLGRYLILDGYALSNLEVLVNSFGDKRGTLLEKLDRCCTFSGKRLIRQWICSPLCSISAIKARQVAVKELMEKTHVLSEIRAIFKHIPDLERLVGKIHVQGNAIRSETHPESRAIYFEDKTYSKRKILDFLSALNGFSKLQTAIEILQKETPFSSEILNNCVQFSPKGQFPDLSSSLKFFEDAFDHELAKKEGCIIPKSSGLDSEYDAVLAEMKDIEIETKEYLKSQSNAFGTVVKYFGTDKNRYQLEIPESAARRAGPEYEITSSRKGFKRFMTSKTKEFLRRQMQAEETKSNILKDLSRRVFAQFSDKSNDWNSASQIMSVLDVLMSLAEYCRLEEGPLCVPQFTEPKLDTKPFINIKNGRHPCIGTHTAFIPNDTLMGVEDFKNVILLTGPNMGGKSTLMRQAGLIVIMAQMGCLVPAESCELTPVDRIFTRIGANDDIMAGQSTFFVELNETSLILHHATKHSFVLVDELGRGTSTYDGTAIAYSVVKELADMQCRTFFSTHYHTLVEDLKNADSISLGHMSCVVETDEDDPSEETVTFLYKFAQGACPKSHGFNAAKLAGVPMNIIKMGRKKAEDLEKAVARRELFRNIFKTSDSEELSKLISLINSVL